VILVCLLMAAWPAAITLTEWTSPFAGEPAPTVTRIREYPEGAIRQAEQEVQALITERKIPGLAVAVAEDSGIIWSQAFGFADLEGRVPAKPGSARLDRPGLQPRAREVPDPAPARGRQPVPPRPGQVRHRRFLDLLPRRLPAQVVVAFPRPPRAQAPARVAGPGPLGSGTADFMTRAGSAMIDDASQDPVATQLWTRQCT
jgi:hypothetical protein